tara:strand:+ start:3196 stop:3981 length:786 start_codon:yes stop_codon:yes gene_type:complete
VNKEEYFQKIEKKLKSLGVKKNSVLIVCADLLKLLILFRKDKINFSPDELINLFIRVIGKSGTLIFYSFNWNFFKGKIFDYKNSKSFSGTLSNYALKRKDFKRSKNPVYSFLVYGKYKNKICNMKHDNCFSLNSPFGFLLKKNAKCILIDLDYKNSSYPFFHVAEQKANVYYRFYKNFSGKVIEKGFLKNIKIKMFVREKGYKITTIYSKKTDNILKKLNALNLEKFKNIRISFLNVKKLYEITVKQFKIENQMILRKKSD